MKKFLLSIIIFASLNVFISCDNDLEYNVGFLDSCGFVYPCEYVKCVDNSRDRCKVNVPYDCRKDNICLKYSSGDGPEFCNEEDGQCYLITTPCTSHLDCTDDPLHDNHCCDLEAGSCSNELFCHYQFNECSYQNGCSSERCCEDSVGRSCYPEDTDCRVFNICTSVWSYVDAVCNENDGKCYPVPIDCEEDIDCANAGYPELICNITAGKCEDPPPNN